jgi:hypothetical protein
MQTAFGPREGRPERRDLPDLEVGVRPLLERIAAPALAREGHEALLHPRVRQLEKFDDRPLYERRRRLQW